MYKNKIAELAKREGKTYKHLAKQCHVSPQTFHSWINNKTQPDIIQGYILAKELNVSSDDLIKEENKE
jgi:putative transcriptional regulator